MPTSALSHPVRLFRVSLHVVCEHLHLLLGKGSDSHSLWHTSTFAMTRTSLKMAKHVPWRPNSKKCPSAHSWSRAVVVKFGRTRQRHSFRHVHGHLLPKFTSLSYLTLWHIPTMCHISLFLVLWADQTFKLVSVDTHCSCNNHGPQSTSSKYTDQKRSDIINHQYCGLIHNLAHQCLHTRAGVNTPGVHIVN